MFLARFLFRNLKGYRFLIVFAIIMTFAEVGSDIASALPLKFIIDKFTLPSHPDPVFWQSAFLLNTIRKTVPGSKESVVVLAVSMIIVLGLLSALLTFTQKSLAYVIAKNLTVRLSRQLFNHLQHLTISWHNTQRPGDLVQRITSNMDDLEKFVADGMVDLLTGTLTLLGVVIIMFYTSPPLTLISIVIIPLLTTIVFFYTRNIQKSNKKEKKKEGEVANIATDAMAKIMEIKAFTLENLMFNQFEDKSEARFEAGKRAGILQAQFTPLVDIVLAVGTGTIMFVGAMAFIQGSFTFGFLTLTAQQASLGTLTVFLAYLSKLYQPLRDLSKLTTLASSATSAGIRIQEVLDEKPEPLDDSQGYAGPTQFKGNISYQDVFFSYDMTGRLILKGVTLDIPAGKKIALVGLSGSGKTTLTNLLTRFYDLPKDRGFIRLDGKDIMDLPLSVLRHNISMVLQDSILFEGTIAENIRIGNPKATDEEMKKAAEMAVIHETIVNKLGGYDRKITGRDLSGGQRQRLAIARAILRNSPIIIMDEPTAALDAEAEAEVMRALDSLAERRTVLMITHRLTTVGKVDQIVVLQDGRIAEQGTFKELRKKGGIFYKLLSLQNLLTSEDENEGSSIMRTSLVRPDPGSSKGQVEVKINGQTIGTRELDKVVLTIGSLAGNDIQITSSPYISRLHAKILWENNGWVIRDADSLNKVYINGDVTEEHRLIDGDHIYLGHPGLKPQVELLYRGVNAAQVKPTPSKTARVVIEVDGQPVGMRELNKAILMVGREPGKDVPLDVAIPDSLSTKEVSRLQAQIVWENGAWVIKKDQNAKNKLFYNGGFVDQHMLVNGDRVYLAPKVSLLYEAMAPVGAR